MTKTLLTTIVCVAAASVASGQIATELFDYAPGTAFGGLNGGSGWAGAWTLNTGTDGVIAADGITAQNGFSSQGPHLSIDNGASGSLAETRYERELANPVDDVAGNWIYLSYYVSADSTDDGNPQGFTAAGLGFVNTGNFGAGGPGGQTVLVGRFGANGDIRNWKQGGGVAEQDLDQADRITIYEPNFLVTGIYFRGPDLTDSTFTWINPTSPDLDTADADIVREMGPALNVIDGIGGKVTQQDPLTVRFDDIRVGTTPDQVIPNGTLPVRLSRFEATAVDAGVELAWTTASERDNAGFAVERSRDGATWTEIAFVAGYGQSDSPRDYTFRDGDAAPGNRYYRLRQLDFDGAATYSAVVSTRAAGDNDATDFTLEGDFSAGPFATVRHDGDVARDFEIFSAHGQRLATFSVGAGESYRVDLAGLSAGYYLMRSGRSVRPFVRR